MRKFILNSALFFGLLLVCNTVVYFFAKDVYHDDYNVVPDKNFNSFIFADSYGLALSDYGEDHNLFNFAAASDSYFDIKRKITYLIHNGYEINKVYIGVDNHSLSTNRERMNNLDRSVYYTTVKDFDNPFTYFKNRYLVYYGAIFRPSVRTLLRSYLFQEARSLVKLAPKKGIGDLDWPRLPEEIKQKEAESIVALQFGSKERSRLLSETLTDIIALSKEHGFELVGVKFPVTEAYLNAMNNANFVADELFASHGIPVLNYKRKYLDKNELFADPNHLNDKGGQRFIKNILREP